MALSGNRLGDAMLAAVQAAVAGHTQGQPISGSELTAIWRGVGNAIVNEFTANSVVTTPFVTGVTAGAANSGAGTGSIG